MGKGSKQSASRFLRGVTANHPNLSRGGSRPPPSADGIYQFGPPLTFAPRHTVTLGDALDPGAPGPKNVVTRPHVNWGHASARQLKRVPVYANGDT